MKHEIKHDLDASLAKKAADKAWESYQERFAKYTPRATWTSETHADIQFSVKGFTLKGALDLAPKAIVLDLDVPFLLKPFKSQAISIIETEIQKWVGKAKSGEI